MSGAAAKAAGLPTETMKKYGAGGNRSAHSAQMSRLENDTETLTHTKVSTETKKLIMQARMAKKMSQKDLATAINEKPQTIQVRLARTAPPHATALVHACPARGAINPHDADIAIDRSTSQARPSPTTSCSPRWRRCWGRACARPRARRSRWRVA